MSNNNLPTITDIYNGITITSEMRKNEQFLTLLNQEPPKEWIKTHPFIKDFKYLPIDKVEFLLRTFFGFNWQIIVHECTPVFNGFMCRVSVKFKHPITEEWMQQDGVGAKQLQLRSQTPDEKKNGIKVSFCHENLSNGAIEMACGIAETVAIKDACDKLGALFGSNLNRKDAINYFGNPDLMPEPQPPVLPSYPIERAKKTMQVWIEKKSNPETVINNIRTQFSIDEVTQYYIETGIKTGVATDFKTVQDYYETIPEHIRDNPDVYDNFAQAADRLDRDAV